MSLSGLKGSEYKHTEHCDQFYTPYADRLVVTECANFAAQLPMLVRGFYYEGWKPESVPKKIHRQEFLEEIQNDFRLSIDGGTERLVEGVLRAMSRHIEPSIIAHLKAELPKDLWPFFDLAA